MAANQQILREYLLSLGFKTNNDQQRVFDGTLRKTHINVMGLGKAVVGVGVAAQAMVALFARSMEQMYYSSRKAETTVGNLQAFEYAAKSIGVGGDQMRAALEGMARAIRLNPGLQGLVESFGIKVTGRDKADVAVDLLDTLRKMPFYLGSQYASMFGIDADTFLLLSEGLDKFKEMAASRKQMAADAGLDTEAAAAAAKDYAGQLREIVELFGILKDTAAVAMLPVFKELAGVTREVLRDWTKIIKERSLKDFKDAVVHATTGEGSWWDSFLKWGGYKGRKPTGATAPAAKPKAEALDPGSLFDGLEQQYGLPMGLLDKIWQRESNRGQNMGPSKAGAEGHFQFMPGTAKRFGVNPQDLASSAEGAAKYLQLLLERYDGDDQLAAMAYNAGEGRIDKFLAGQGKPLTSETLNYGAAISGRPVMVHQLTNINVNGQDPESNGRAVAREQSGVNSEMGAVIRNQLGAVR